MHSFLGGLAATQGLGQSGFTTMQSAWGPRQGSMLRVPLLLEIGHYFGAGAIETFNIYSLAAIFLTCVTLFFFASLRSISRVSK